MKFRLIEPGDPSWLDIVTNSDCDIYHLPDYGVATTPGNINAAVVSNGTDSLLLPLVLNEIPAEYEADSTLRDATTPYGYSGPITTLPRPHRAAFIREATKCLIDGLATESVVSLFVRLHPFVGITANELGNTGSIVRHGPTVLIDLRKPAEELWSQTRKNVRYDIRKAAESGTVAQLDGTGDLLPEFVTMYHETMSRAGATADYYFSLDYFVRLFAQLRDNIHLWYVEINGELAAAALFTEFKGIIQYHLSGMRTQFDAHHPTKVIIDTVRSWARARGNVWMHLGGGVNSKEDSLYRFKRGFSPDTESFSTWRAIVQPSTYRDLVDRRPVSQARSDYFPEYRP